MLLHFLRLKFSFFLPSCIERKSWQKNQSLSYSNIFNNVNKEFLPKNPFQKVPPTKKISPPKNPLKIFLPNKSSQNSFKTKKVPKNSPKKSKKFLKKFLGFWQYQLPYIALKGEKPFRACSFYVFEKNILLQCIHTK